MREIKYHNGETIKIDGLHFYGCSYVAGQELLDEEMPDPMGISPKEMAQQPKEPIEDYYRRKLGRELLFKKKQKLEKQRSSNVVWMDPVWIYRELHPLVHEANANAGWNFQWDFSESCQFTKYVGSKKQHYDWHTDSGVRPNSNGKIRKNNLEDFSSINTSGKIAMKLDSNDKIVGVKICQDDQDVILSTKFGKCIRFEAKKLRVFKGRSSKGIKGIELAPNDQIVSLSVIDNDKINKNGKKSKDEKSELRAKEKFVLSISENGYGKKTSHTDYRVTNRGGKGIIGIVNSPRNGNITSSFPVYEGDEILISTNKGRVIRVAVKEIRTAGRNTQGVTIIKLSGEEKVVSAIKIDDNLI